MRRSLAEWHHLLPSEVGVMVAAKVAIRCCLLIALVAAPLQVQPLQDRSKQYSMANSAHGLVMHRGSQSAGQDKSVQGGTAEEHRQCSAQTARCLAMDRAARIWQGNGRKKMDCLQCILHCPGILHQTIFKRTFKCLLPQPNAQP